MISDDLPLPVDPITPIRSPAFTLKLISLKTLLPSFSYAKLTFLNSISPLISNASIHSSQFSKSISSSKTSTTLYALTAAREMKINIIANIINPNNICILKLLNAIKTPTAGSSTPLTMFIKYP